MPLSAEVVVHAGLAPALVLLGDEEGVQGRCLLGSHWGCTFGNVVQLNGSEDPGHTQPSDIAQKSETGATTTAPGDPRPQGIGSRANFRRRTRFCHPFWPWCNAEGARTAPWRPLHCFLLSGSALTDHERRALLRATDPETRRLWLLSLTHTTNTTSPPNNGRRSGPERVRSSRRRVHVGRRPCVVVGGLPVPRSRTPTTRCRAGAYATGITPGVCVRALDVHGRGCAGDGLLQRRDDRRQRTHERKAGPAE